MKAFDVQPITKRVTAELPLRRRSAPMRKENPRWVPTT